MIRLDVEYRSDKPQGYVLTLTMFGIHFARIFKEPPTPLEIVEHVNHIGKHIERSLLESKKE